MENAFYTNYDIQLLTGLSLQEANDLISKLNYDLLEEYQKYHLDIQIYENKILKEYFIKRMES